MANKIQFKRGAKALLPTLAVGEPALTTDTKELFVGHPDGNIELATAAQLSNKPNKSDLVLNVKDFGAKGDNSDDTVAIQNAINAAGVVGGVVRFPSVQYWYRVTDTLDIPSSVRLIGDNWSFSGSTLLRFVSVK